MYVLAIDSTMNGCSACIYKHDDDSVYNSGDRKSFIISSRGEVLANKSLEISRGQAEHLIPIIENVIDSSGIRYNNIDLLAVTNGPGAFTGMRVSLASAKAIGLAADIPVIGVSTFSAILDTYFQYQEAEKKNYKGKEDVESKSFSYYGVILDTKRKDYYFQMFDRKNNQYCMNAIVCKDKEILSIIDNKDCLLIGDIAKDFIEQNHIAGKYHYHVINKPEATAVARVGVIEFIRYGDSNGCELVYLREPEIGKTKNPPRVME